MRVFVTGATGFIGSAVVRELIDSGHDVVGLARSDRAALALAEAGAEVHRGSLEDQDSLRAAATDADGVIHTAFIHDFSTLDNSADVDLRAVETIGATLEGSDRPLVITTGTALVGPGRVVTEEDFPTADTSLSPRFVSERTALGFAERGVRSSVVRPGTSVHGERDHGFVPILIDIARNQGASGYIGEGSNRWPAVHRLDAARLYPLALEQATAGSVFHAIGDEGVPARDIAEIIGRHLSLPVVSVAPEAAADHFGWMARFWALDAPASSALTQKWLGWTPTHRGLIEDLEAGHYFEPARAAAA